MRRQKAEGERQKAVGSRQGAGRRGRRAHSGAPPVRASAFRLPPSAYCLLLTAFCLLPSAFFFRAGAQKEPEDSPAQTAAFHRWGAVTLFHGLPSDRVRAIAQDAEGLMWFGTDAGLARYDGRRTQTVTDEGLASRRVHALRADAEGSLWVGTDAGAFLRTPAGEFVQLTETKGKAVTALIAPSPGRALLATSDGLVFDCRRHEGRAYTVEQVGERILPAQTTGAGAGTSANTTKQPLELTSLALVGDTILVGTRGRGLLAVERGATREVVWRPRSYFVEALEQDGARLLLGAQAPAADSGLFRVDAADPARAGDPSQLRPTKVAGEATGTVTALRSDGIGNLYVGTDGRGVFRMRDGRRVERFTFSDTAGALRSDRVYSVFVDREGVAWFGTDRGVCRYDPRGLRVETVSEERDSNFVRALYRAPSGALYAGTNRGLFVRDAPGAGWRFVEALGRRTVYSVTEDRRGRVLVGTVAGLYASLPPTKAAPVRFVPERAKEEKKEEEKVEPATGSKPLGESDDAAPQPEQEAAKAEAPATSPQAEVKPEAEKAEQSAPTAAPVVAGNVRAIAAFGGSVYIATFGRGVERLDEEFRRTAVWPRPGGGEEEARLRETVSLHADERAGRLWVGTAAAGVFYFDGEQMKTEPALDQLSRAGVRGVSAGAGGWLWLATSQGLYAYGPDGQLIALAEGTQAHAVYAPREGAGLSLASSQPGRPQAWFATAGGGVVKALLDEQFGRVTSALDAEQGLPSENAFALLALDAGETATGPALLVGTTRGLALYEPGGTPPVVRPTRLTAARPLPLEELQREGGLQLDYPQNGLVFDVAATSSRTFPEQFQYAFLLEDSAGKVIKRKLSHDSLFQFEGLKPGRYRVTARAFSIDLERSSPLAFEFVVRKAPFPLMTAALSTLLALALVALIWGYVQHRKIVRSRTELYEANSQLAAARLQLANEAESERRRIARDLHDQTLADLRRLMLVADEMQQSAPAGNGSPTPAAAGTDAARPAPAFDPASLRSEIESVSQEIRRICEDLSPSVLENVGFAAALEWALAERVAHMPPECKFAYEFDCDDNLEERLHFAPGVQMQIYRIVQEAVSNVCRHAEAARVRLAVEVTGGNDFLLTLEDDGRGFDTADRKRRQDGQGGRGLASIRARASMIDADVRWHRRPDDDGGGTRFTLRKTL